MTDPEGHPRFEVKVIATDHFSWLRTRFTVELTIMAWLLTAVSLIGFGFAIVQFFERMRQRSKSHLGSHLYDPGLTAPHQIGGKPPGRGIAVSL